MPLNQLGEDSVKRIIRGLGLTEVEAKTYIFLAKRGPLKGGETARNLRMPKPQVYNVLKKLQSKGWANSTLEFPARFEAIPLVDVVDSKIGLKREEAQVIESTREDLLSLWDSIRRNGNEPSPDKFVVIEGLDKIFVKIFQMIKEARSEIKVLAIGSPLVQTMNAGADQVLYDKLKKSQIDTKILVQISKDSHKIISQGLAEASRQGVTHRFEWRYLADSNFCCRFTIKDKKNALFFLTPRSAATPRERQEETALWTNSSAVVDALSVLFDQLWIGASDPFKSAQHCFPFAT